MATDPNYTEYSQRKNQFIKGNLWWVPSKIIIDIEAPFFNRMRKIVKRTKDAIKKQKQMEMLYWGHMLQWEIQEMMMIILIIKSINW